MVPAQVLAPQLTVSAAGQVPLPSHTARMVAMLLEALQLAARHSLSIAGYVHSLRSAPSQVPAHAVPAPAQGACPARGVPAPITATQVPFMAPSAQASHEPSQAFSQHTPSTQN